MPGPLPSRDEIIASLRARTKASHAGDIAKACGIERRDYSALLALLDQLVMEGTLRRLGGHRYTLPKERRERPAWNGILSLNPRGFAFVASSGQPDVYVAPPWISGAMHGDTVRIEVVAKSHRGVEGHVIGVERRRDPRVAGTLRRAKKSLWLEPDDPRIRGPIVLEEASGAGRTGDAAVVEITRFPEHVDENPEGRLMEVLGRSGDPQVEVEKILVREQIREDHPEAAMAEAERIVMRARRLELGRREDLRDVPFLTIDPADARDHDDAVYAERTRTGFRVYVAIADVSEYVQVGSSLDAEARARGCTIYLPDRAIPMLPGVLAADVCSLLPDCERYCLCVIAELDERGNPRDYRIVEGLMRAAAMVTYDSAARTLGFTDKPPLSAQAEAFKKPLKVLATIAERLRKARLARGALDLDLPEPKLLLDEETGAPLEVRQQKGDPGIKRAYQLVEEMMLLANELVARWLGKRQCPTIYRVHGRPDEQKLERLGNAAEVLGAAFDLDEMSEPLGVSRWLQSIQTHPAREVLEGLLLRSLKQAVYDIVDIGHFGLASSSYLHFTSPIRRYPDLLVHRALKRLARREPIDTSEAAIEQLREAATHSSFRERAAMQVEREVVDLYRALYMRDHIGEQYTGRITALLGSGLIVAVADPYIELLVRFEELGSDRYELSEDELSYVGQSSREILALGDPMLVEATDVSIARRTVYGRRVPPLGTRKRERTESTGGRQKPRRRVQKGSEGKPSRPAKGGSSKAREGDRKGDHKGRGKGGRRRR